MLFLTQNFVKNVNGGRVNIPDIDACWELIENTSNANKALNNTTIEDSKRKTEDNDEKPAKKLKLNGEDQQNGEAQSEKKKKKNKNKSTEIKEQVVAESISETPNNGDINGIEKKKKKKNKKQVEDKMDVVENILSETKVEDDLTLSGDKKNESKNINGQETSIIDNNNLENGEKIDEKNVDEKMPQSEKKKKKKKSSGTIEIPKVENPLENGTDQVAEKEVLDKESSNEKNIVNGGLQKSNKKKRKSMGTNEVGTVIESSVNGINAVQENEDKANAADNENSKKLKSDKKKKRKSVEINEEVAAKIESSENGINAVQENGDKANAADNENAKKPKSDKKKKTTEIAEDPKVKEIVEENQPEIENGGFKWEEKVMEVLQNKNAITVKKLEKKLTAEYKKLMGVTEVSEKILKKFNKKLKKMNTIQITDDTVSLKQ